MENAATRDAYGEALKEVGSKCSKIIVLDADLSKSTKTNIFAENFPDRFFNVGIAEQNLMGIAAGLATCNKIPFVSTFATFATGRAYEQIRNSICYPKLNVKIAASHAGLTVGEDGATHQSIEDISLMRTLPNMIVIVPADATETSRVINFAASYTGPVYIRLGRLKIPKIFGDDYIFNFGKAVQLSDGNSLTIIACGIMVSFAISAAAILLSKGHNVRVLNMPTIKPLDKIAIINAVRDTGAIVTCEEHSIYGGLGSAVAEIMGEYCPAPFERIGIMDSFGESGTPENLLHKYHLTPEDIVAAAERVICRK